MNNAQIAQRQSDLFPQVDGGSTPTSALQFSTSQFDGKWRESCRLRECSVSDVSAMIQKHYLHCRPAVVEVCFVAECNGEPFGMVIYSQPPRETHKRYGGPVLELARLWAKDCCPKNTETWMIAASVRLLRKSRPELVGLVSYADPSVGHSGIIYRASGWSHDGMQDEGRKTPRCDYFDKTTGKKVARFSHAKKMGIEVDRKHRTPKHRYYLPLIQKRTNVTKGLALA